MTARHLTIRDVPADVVRALEKEKRRRGASLNETVKALLRSALDLGGAPARENGLRAHAGGWSDADLAEFEKNTACFETIDPETWR